MRISRSLIGIIAAFVVAALPLASPAQVGIGVGINIGTAPPPLPVYSMPYAPGPNYQWEPGYWAYGAYGYYWVPGTWVAAPAVGLYWTPGYWGWGGGGYAWNAGYWGPSVGFYGGINYGFGYFGTGFVGGIWSGGVFRYNTAIMRVPGSFRNVYVNRTVINNYYNHSRVSYNGGRGGIVARPTAAQRAAYARRRFGPTSTQLAHQRVAAADRNMYARYNHGRPRVTAVSRPFNARNRPAHFAAIHNTAVHNTTVHRTMTVHNTTVHRTTVTHRAARPAYHPPTSHHSSGAYHSRGAYHSSGAYRSSAYHSSAYHSSAYHSSAYHSSGYHPAAHPGGYAHPGGGPGGRPGPGGGHPAGGGHPSSGSDNGGGHHPPHA